MCSVKRLDHYLNMFFVLGLLLVSVVAVPTSVLVQNSEVTSNINAANKNHNFMSKVKRSSNNANEMISKGASSDAESATANRKSSPEVLPPAFNVPIAPQQSASNNNGNANKINGNTNSNSLTDSQLSGNHAMPSNEEIINSAIAAGLTAAAASASQRDLEQQQQQLKQQALLYGDEEAPTLLHKRGISNQQYLYGGMGGLGGAYGYGNGNGNGYGSGSAGGSASGNNVYPAAEYYNNPYLNNPLTVGGGGAGLAAVPNGVWADEMDPSVVYTDVQDDDYLNGPRASSYRNKAYDNLQNILNAEAYPESMALPMSQPQYTSRYYGAINGNKRSNRFDSNSGGAMGNHRLTDMRLKRDTKLTPADMLALVALVEAGERARKDSDSESSNNNYMYPTAGMNVSPDAYNNYNGIKTYYPTASNTMYDYPTNADDVEENGAASWMEPNMVDYYGLPMNVEAIPKYELPREHKYGRTLGAGNGNRFGLKRFMVAKKKRSMGTFLNDPVSKPSMSYNSNGEKFY